MAVFDPLCRRSPRHDGEEARFFLFLLDERAEKENGRRGGRKDERRQTTRDRALRNARRALCWRVIICLNAKRTRRSPTSALCVGEGRTNSARKDNPTNTRMIRCGSYIEFRQSFKHYLDFFGRSFEIVVARLACTSFHNSPYASLSKGGQPVAYCPSGWSFVRIRFVQ